MQEMKPSASANAANRTPTLTVQLAAVEKVRAAIAKFKADAMRTK